METTGRFIKVLAKLTSGRGTHGKSGLQRGPLCSDSGQFHQQWTMAKDCQPAGQLVLEGRDTQIDRNGRPGQKEAQKRDGGGREAAWASVSPSEG